MTCVASLFVKNMDGHSLVTASAGVALVLGMTRVRKGQNENHRRLRRHVESTGEEMTNEMIGDFLNTPIKQNELVAFKQQRVCQMCRKGFMVSGDTTKLSIPPWYPHTCDKCGHNQD